MFSLNFLRRSSLMGTTLRAAPRKRYVPFQQIIMHVLQCPHDVDVHLLFCFGSPKVMFISLMGTTLHAAPRKRYGFEQMLMKYYNVHMMCTSYFWPWPPYNLFPRLSLTSIFLINLRWCSAQCPAKANAIITNYQVCIAMPTLCRHAPPICFDLDLHLTCSCFCSCPRTCSTINCWQGASLVWQELVISRRADYLPPCRRPGQEILKCLHPSVHPSVRPSIRLSVCPCLVSAL